MFFNDRDFKQKIKFQRIMWQMGFWTRIEIPVIAYELDAKTQLPKRHDLTDMDVYGEKVNNDFYIIKQLGDCKSGKNVKMVERVFWLKGVMDYVGTNKGYLIKNKISRNIRVILDRLNIYGIDNNNLIEMERIYNTSKISNLFNEEYYTNKLEIINSLTDEYSMIYKYLNVRYWFNDNPTNLKTLLVMLEKNDFYKNFKYNDKTHKFILMEIVILFCRTIFECCNYIMHRNISAIPQGVLEYIHGGVNGLTNKINLVRDMRPILQKITNTEDIGHEVFIEPHYLSKLTHLVGVFISEPNNVMDIMRYLELLQYEIIIEKKLDFEKMISSFSPVTLKISKDVITSYLNITKVNEEVLSSVLNR